MATLKEKLIDLQQNGEPITIGFADIGLQVFKADTFLDRALWKLDMELLKEPHSYFLVDIYDSFGSRSVTGYELDDGIYIDLDIELE